MTDLFLNPQLTGDFVTRNRSLKYFWIGFIAYTVIYALAFPFQPRPSILVMIQLLTLTLFIPALFGLIQFKINSGYLGILYVFYLVWMLFTVKRGLSFNSSLLISAVVNANSGILLYIVPIALLFSRNFFLYKKIFDVIIILGIFYVVLDIFFIRDLLNPDRSSAKSQAAVESLSQYLSFPMSFIVFTLRYHSKKRQWFAAAVMILSLFFIVLRARRGLILIFGVSIIFSFILYLLSTRRKFIIIPLAAMVIFLATSYVQEAFTQKSTVFGFLSERGTEDTRSPVEECFYDDMETKDWIVGRGMNGEYFCPIVEEDADIRGYRRAIETGYLQIILNGGMISLGLILLMAVPAMICGIFFSKNVLCRACGFWILLWILSLYPANVATFSLNYILVWVAIGICYSKKIRNIPEEIMKQAFI